MNIGGRVNLISQLECNQSIISEYWNMWIIEVDFVV